MKIYIPSYNRPKAIKTIKMLDRAGADYVVLLHDAAQADAYLDGGLIKSDKILVTNQPLGITNQRRFILKNLVKRGDWFVSLDDNISGFYGVDDLNWSQKSKLNVTSKNFDKKIFNNDLSWRQVVKRLEISIDQYQKKDIHYIGFATVPNYYFLGQKHRFVGYVISKAVAIHHVGPGYDPSLEAMEDYGFCAEHLLMFGRVLIDNWVIPDAGHYESGGIGTYDQRLPRKIKDAAYLITKYPGLFRYKVKANCHPKAELQIRFTSLDQVKLWRRSLGVIK